MRHVAGIGYHPAGHGPRDEEAGMIDGKLIDGATCSEGDKGPGVSRVEEPTKCSIGTSSIRACFPWNGEGE